MELKPMKRDEVQSIVQDAVTSAVDFIESEISGERLKAQRYFDGEVDIGHEEGRSKVVATKCRDTVRAIKPALMRAFLSTTSPVEFIPRQPDDVAAAEQATQYVNYKFNQSGGYRLLADAFHDALVKKTGILKAYYETKEKVEIDEYSDLTDEQFALIVDDDDIEIVEHSEEIEAMPGPMGEIVQVTLHNCKISRKTNEGDICIESIAPEDFFINREATCIEDAYVVGHRNSDMRVGDLVAMGYDFREVVEHAGDEDSAYQDEADMERAGFNSYGDDDNKADPSMLTVLTTEAYMKVDVDGTGVPIMHRFVLIGTKYHLLDMEPADFVPFAAFEVDPEPHTFFGRSIVDIIINDQDAATSMLRGVLDNVALTNTPRVAILDGKVNVDDVLNNEIGGVVREQVPNAVRPMEVPFTAGSVLPALQYYDEVIEGKTGVSRASMGLDPDALQNTTAAAVNAMTAAATGQVEMIARNLAEGGMKQLFKLLLQITKQHAEPEEMMRLNGNFVPVDPRSWNTGMDLICNVGLGTGGEVEREMVLRETLQNQMQIWQAYGPGNGLVTMTQIRNTLADILKSGGLHNAARYYMPMTPELEQMLLQQAQQAAQAAAQGQPDPNAALAQAEVAKAQISAQAKLQGDQMRSQQKMQADILKAEMDARQFNAEDDRKRDEMDMNLVLQAAKILGEYGIKVDQQRIQQMQAAPRNNQ